MKHNFEIQDWQVIAIQQGLAAADRGEFIDHADVKAKWEKRLATMADKAKPPGRDKDNT